MMASSEIFVSLLLHKWPALFYQLGNTPSTQGLILEFSSLQAIFVRPKVALPTKAAKTNALSWKFDQHNGDLQNGRPDVHLLRFAPSSVKNDENVRSALLGSGKKLGSVDRSFGRKQDEDVRSSQQLPELPLIVAQMGAVVEWRHPGLDKNLWRKKIW